jgi:GDPmannose 4,6-dehydratase
LEMSFQHVGLDWEKYVCFDDRYLRPTEVDTLVADPSKAESTLNWKARVGPMDLAKIMVDHDLATLDKFVIDQHHGGLW